MKLTYDGEFGSPGYPEYAGQFGLPDLSGVTMADRGLSQLGTFAGHSGVQAHVQSEAQWRAETLRSAAREWDSYAGDGRNFKPNPWLGETALPAPGQPHK